jgi:hypothetical protein
LLPFSGGGDNSVRSLRVIENIGILKKEGRCRVLGFPEKITIQRAFVSGAGTG